MKYCADKEKIYHPEPIKLGYTFDCWEDKDGVRAKAGQWYIVTEDHEFKAVWQEEPGPDPGPTGSPFEKGKPLAGAEAAMQDLPNDDDPDGTVFSSLRPNSTKQTGTSAKLRWNKVKGAARYNVYAAKCGAKYKLTRVATVRVRRRRSGRSPL